MNICVFLFSVAADKKQRIACVGAGPAGLAFATEAAGRGHSVTLFEKDDQLGGQFNLAKVVPGKEEFYETIRYFKNMLEVNDVDVKLGTEATPELLEGFDSIVLATGKDFLPCAVLFDRQYHNEFSSLNGRCNC